MLASEASYGHSKHANCRNFDYAHENIDWRFRFSIGWAVAMFTVRLGQSSYSSESPPSSAPRTVGACAARKSPSFKEIERRLARQQKSGYSNNRALEHSGRQSNGRVAVANQQLSRLKLPKNHSQCASGRATLRGNGLLRVSSRSHGSGKLKQIVSQKFSKGIVPSHFPLVLTEQLKPWPRRTSDWLLVRKDIGLWRQLRLPVIVGNKEQLHDWPGRILLSDQITIALQCIMPRTISDKLEWSRFIPDYPEQEVSIGGELSDKGLGPGCVCTLATDTFDYLFAWEPKNMTVSVASTIRSLNQVENPTGIFPSEAGKKTPARLPSAAFSHSGGVAVCAWDFIRPQLSMSTRLLIHTRDRLGTWNPYAAYPFKCFLDAYKGYHQIQNGPKMRGKDSLSQQVMVMSIAIPKMPFGLMNAGASLPATWLITRSRDKWPNLEVYVETRHLSDVQDKEQKLSSNFLSTRARCKEVIVVKWEVRRFGTSSYPSQAGTRHFPFVSKLTQEVGARRETSIGLRKQR
ncbi:hypothetical protein Tco_0155669 [Tanacetum coccineum]